MSVLYVFLGGGLGALLRFFIILFVSEVIFAKKQIDFPHHTATANILSCLIVGLFLSHFVDTANLNYINFIKHFVFIGFAGALSTFSAFALDTVLIYNSGQRIKSLSYLFATLFLSFLALYIGVL